MADGRAVFNFVKPAQFDTVLNLVANNFVVSSDAARDLQFPVICGAMGSGKSRFGAEICKAVSRHPFFKGKTILTAYLPSPSILSIGGRDLANANDCLNVLAEALLASLYSAKPANLTATIHDIKAKLDSQGVYGVVIQVDEFATAAEAAKMILSGCRWALGQNVRVVPVVTGIRSLVNLAPLDRGSKYLLNYYIAEPLTTPEQSNALIKAFAEYINVSVKNVHKCEVLTMIINDCGGYPASLRLLADQILKLEERFLLHFRNKGSLSFDVAQTLHASVVKNLSDRYAEGRWRAVFGQSGNSDKRLSDGTRALLSRLLLVAATEMHVLGNSPVVENKPFITYERVENEGFVSLKPVDSKGGVNCEHIVIIPLIALGVMNEMVDEIKGGVLTNPFKLHFEIVEKLAMSSLHARLRALRAMNGPNSTCTLADLRPDALVFGNVDELLVSVPDEASYHEVNELFGSTSIVTTGVGGGGPATPCTDGTCVVCAEREEGIDGALILSGSLNGSSVNILFLMQGKSKARADSKSTMQAANVQKVIDRALKAKPNVFKNWLTDRPQLPYVIILDVFSDRDEGPKLKSSQAKIKLPNLTIAVVTTGARLQNCIGAALSIRSRLKRPLPGVADEGRTKQSCFG